MAEFLFIESRDPLADRTIAEHFNLMRDLVSDDHQVDLFLVQDAVLLGRLTVEAAELEALAQQGVRVHADDFSLLQRGIDTAEIRPFCTVSPISRVVEALETECKVIWN